MSQFDPTRHEEGSYLVNSCSVFTKQRFLECTKLIEGENK